MKKTILSFAVVALSAVSVFAAELTVEGTISKVVPAKKEIYVMSEGKKYEFYFRDFTTLTQNGEAKEFDVLKVDQKVKVETKKVGKRLDPVKVEILN